MKLWIKRAIGIVLILAGVLLVFHHGKQLLDWPHLYPDTGRIGLGNLVFFGLMLLAGPWPGSAAPICCSTARRELSTF
ncbi:MAG: hypothetical protein J5789_02810 [Oscillospiraceae bacterium]|nr:hypothetical protein [Oscillospiraceae bacterium]